VAIARESAISADGETQYSPVRIENRKDLPLVGEDFPLCQYGTPVAIVPSGGFW
jgi:hypothetical protein